jgi:hypothetical protein
MVDNSIIRIPATCPMCGQEYLVGLELETISDRLATGRSIKLDCARGHITVLDRARLEKRSCECYSVVKREYDRLLPVAAAC